MSSGAEETSVILHLVLPEDVQWLADQIHKHCNKIPVAKKESLQLTNLCDKITKRLRDCPLIPQQSDYEAIKSNLTHVEEQLAGWSKYNLPKSLMRRSQIELGVAGCVERLVSVFSKQPDGGVMRLGKIAFAGGIYCEVWVGRWVKGGGEVGGEKVALKTLRTLKATERTRERLERELPTWAKLRHQNILPFYGAVTDVGSRLYMVSPWRGNGTLLVYVKNNPKSDKNHLLRGSASGLNYLHSQDVVHGSVRCKNVLISGEGEPQICDFGIAPIVEEVTENTATKTQASGDVVRYSAPELIENNDVSATTHSDTYSFAMLILECITEEVPFPKLSRHAAIIHTRITKRQLPPRPDGQHPKNRVSDGLWDLMMRCWSVEPDDRPTMGHVHSFFLNQV